MTRPILRFARAALAGAGAILLSLPLQAADPLLGKEKSTICAAYHGADGNSPSPEFPRIGGQHEDYLLQAPGRVAKGQIVVRIDERYHRPAEVDTLLGDAAKAREKLGWMPEIGFAELVAEMVREDLRAAERETLVRQHGHAVHKRNDG